jgi:hypothetical protein
MFRRMMWRHRRRSIERSSTVNRLSNSTTSLPSTSLAVGSQSWRGKDTLLTQSPAPGRCRIFNPVTWNKCRAVPPRQAFPCPRLLRSRHSHSQDY